MGSLIGVQRSVHTLQQLMLHKGLLLHSLIAIQIGLESSFQMSVLLRREKGNNNNGLLVFGGKDGNQIKYKPITKESKVL